MDSDSPTQSLSSPISLYSFSSTIHKSAKWRCDKDDKGLSSKWGVASGWEKHQNSISTQKQTVSIYSFLLIWYFVILLIW